MMKNLDRMLERNQVASFLALQCALRVGGFMGIGMLSAVRKSLDAYLVCLQYGTEHVRQSRIIDSPRKWMAGYADAMTECVEKSWQNFRNNLQIGLLTQGEALIWVTRINRVLLTAD